MNKKFQKLVESIDDPNLRAVIVKSIPAEFQKQFAKFVLRAKRVKPFFIRWLAKNEDGRLALEYVLRRREDVAKVAK